VLIATSRCAAPARCGACADERRNAARARAIPRRSVGHRRACASLFASFAAGVALAGAPTDDCSSHRRAHRRLPFAAPASCGAFADERRVVASDGTECIRTRKAHPAQRTAAPPPLRASVRRVAAERVEVPAVRSGAQGRIENGKRAFRTGVPSTAPTAMRPRAAAGSPMHAIVTATDAKGAPDSSSATRRLLHALRSRSGSWLPP